MKHIWELNWEKKHIIWKVFLHTIWRFEKQSCWGLQQFSNLIQVYWNSVHLLLQNIIINRNKFENSTGKRNISFERSSTYFIQIWSNLKRHLLLKIFEQWKETYVGGLQQFSNLIQVYWNSVHLLLQNIIINWNKIENSTGKRNISFERSSYILFEGLKSNLVEVFNSFQIWSKSIEILCTYYCRTL